MRRLTGNSKITTLVVFFTLILALGNAVMATATLTYALSSALKKDACVNDTDSDCLDNGEEVNLAWDVSPWYFYDEDEDCSGWTNKYGVPATHFQRRDFIQVRPQGSGIRSWSSNDGIAKWVAITFFFNYPHDCRNQAGFGGHQGDDENVRYYLYSYDLTNWYLSYAYYWHHGRVDYVSGDFLEGNARELGTSWASVTADEDSKASWPGRTTVSSDCAGSEDDFCYSTCDCFIGTWASDFRNGYVEVPSASLNIGGPSPESWNPAVLTVSGGQAYYELDVGHGLNREYWTPAGGVFQKFCGWECPTAYRTSGGDCTLTIHERSECTDNLTSKLDTTAFNLDTPPPPVTSCSGYCGTYTGSCWCDASCVTVGDCCGDACAVCGVCGGGLTPYAAAAAFHPGAAGASSRPRIESFLTFLGKTSEATVVPVANRVARAASSEGVDPVRVARAEQLAAAAAARLRGLAASRGGDERRWLLRRAADPLAAVVPMLLDRSPQQQLRTLKWAVTVPDRLRLAFLFDDLQSRGEGRQAREETAYERMLDLIALLEATGIRVPDMPSGFTPAAALDDIPLPNAYPPGARR